MSMANETPKARRLTTTQVVLLIVWAATSLWLIVSMLVSVIGALFFGSGPLNGPGEPQRVIEAPSAVEGSTESTDVVVQAPHR